RGDRDRGERSTHPGRAGSGAGDAFDGAIGASGHPLIALQPDLKVVLAAQPVDFRKSVHTLSALVSEALRANPYCGDVFVFRSRRADRVKLLAWDGSGMVLVTKWLHQGHFTWPPIRDGVVHLSATQLLLRYALDLGQHLSLAKPRQTAAIAPQHQASSWAQVFDCVKL